MRVQRVEADAVSGCGDSAAQHPVEGLGEGPAGQRVAQGVHGAVDVGEEVGEVVEGVRLLQKRVAAHHRPDDDQRGPRGPRDHKGA